MEGLGEKEGVTASEKEQQGWAKDEQEVLSGRSQWSLEKGSKLFSWRPVSFLLVPLQMLLYYHEWLGS